MGNVQCDMGNTSDKQIDYSNSPSIYLLIYIYIPYILMYHAAFEDLIQFGQWCNQGRTYTNFIFHE